MIINNNSNCYRSFQRIKTEWAQFFCCLKRASSSLSLFYLYQCALFFSKIGKNQEKVRQYSLIRKFYSQRCYGAVKAWSIFRGRLNNYAINSENLPTLVNPFQSHEQKKYVDKGRSRKAQDIVIEEEKLSQKKHGICLGATLHFIKEYAKRINQGMDKDQAFSEVSCNQSEGVKRKVALKHSIQLGINCKTASGHYNLESKSEVMAHLFNLHVLEEPRYTRKSEIDVFLDKLPSGSYRADLTTTNKEKKIAGHAIALIKTSQFLYVYDSNFGSAKIPLKHQASVIAKLIHSYGYEEIECIPVGRAVRTDIEGKAFC